MSVTPVVTPTPTEQDWRAGLPEDLRAEKSLESFKSVSDVAKGFIETKKMMGSAIKLPKADAPDTEWEPIYSRLGRPESADKYEFKRPENLPEGMTYQEDLEKNFKEQAHKLGFNNRQAQGLLDWFSGSQVEKFKEQKAAQEASIGELKKEWGGDYDKNLGLAQRAFKELGDEKTAKYLIDSGIGNDPALLRLFAKAGGLLGEAPFIVGEPHTEASDADALEVKIHEITSNPKHAYSDPNAPYRARMAAAEEVLRMREKLAAMRRPAQ